MEVVYLKKDIQNYWIKVISQTAVVAGSKRNKWG
jgi:hypothetical protein